jgi:hypothetical protein
MCSYFAGQAPPPPSPEEEWAGLDGSLYLKHLRAKEFDEYLRCDITNIKAFSGFQIKIRRGVRP